VGSASDSGDEERGGGLESEEEDEGNHVGSSPAADVKGIEPESKVNGGTRGSG
jgi:hypothetical protein